MSAGIRKALPQALLLVLLGCSGLLAADLLFRGNARSLLYGRERFSGDGTEGQPLEDSYRFYQYFRLQLARRAEQSSLAFKSYFRVTDDFNLDLPGDPGWRLYHGYLEWKRGRSEVTVGRQWLHFGPGSLTLDGIQAGYAFDERSRYRLTGYFGSESPFTHGFHLQGIDRTGSGGFYLRALPRPGLELGLGGVQKNRRGEAIQRELGADTQLRLPHRLQLTGRLDVDLLEDRLQKGTVRLDYRELKRWEFQLQYRHYEPRLLDDRYYFRFPLQGHEQVRGGLIYRLRQQLMLSAAWSTIFFGGEETSSFLSFGLTAPYAELIYYRGMGFGGEEDGFSLGGNYLFGDAYRVYAQLNYSAYRFYEELDERDNLVSGVFGFDWIPFDDLTAGIELQDLNDEVFRHDFRVLAKFSINSDTIF